MVEIIPPPVNTDTSEELDLDIELDLDEEFDLDINLDDNEEVLNGELEQNMESEGNIKQKRKRSKKKVPNGTLNGEYWNKDITNSKRQKQINSSQEKQTNNLSISLSELFNDQKSSEQTKDDTQDDTQDDRISGCLDGSSEVPIPKHDLNDEASFGCESDQSFSVRSSNSSSNEELFDIYSDEDRIEVLTYDLHKKGIIDIFIYGILFGVNNLKTEECKDRLFEKYNDSIDFQLICRSLKKNFFYSGKKNDLLKVVNELTFKVLNALETNFEGINICEVYGMLYLFISKPNDERIYSSFKGLGEFLEITKSVNNNLPFIFRTNGKDKEYTLTKFFKRFQQGEKNVKGMDVDSFIQMCMLKLSSLIFSIYYEQCYTQ